MFICPFAVNAEGRSEDIFSLLSRAPSESLSQMRRRYGANASSLNAARLIFPEDLDAHYRLYGGVIQAVPDHKIDSVTYFGFIPTEKIETIVNFSDPPSLERILRLIPGEATNLKSTLLELDYTLQNRWGVPIYVKGDEDFSVDRVDEITSDPFSGFRGYSSRVFLKAMSS